MATQQQLEAQEKWFRAMVQRQRTNTAKADVEIPQETLTKVQAKAMEWGQSLFGNNNGIRKSYNG